ncbi:hypothetical protein Tco_0691614 [Tanacetum coccineum]
MEDEHLNTIPEKESDKVIKSSVEDLVLIPSESKDLTNNESECDMPVCDDSSSKNEGLDDIVSFPPGNDNFNVESGLIESLLNRDTLITSPKIDFLLEDFVGELALINPIPPGIDDADFDPEGDIRLIEKLLYDNSSPRPPKELNSEISNAIIESFSTSPIPVEDSDSLMEEIDTFLAPDDSIPPGIESDGYDSEDDVLLDELLNDDSISLPEFESFHVDLYDDPSSPRPPKKPPDDGGIESDSRILITNVMKNISDDSIKEVQIHVPKVLTISGCLGTLLQFSSKK